MLLALAGCGSGGGGEDSSEALADAPSDETLLQVSMETPTRLAATALPLTVNVSVAGERAVLEANGSGYAGSVTAPANRQLPVYLDVRRAEDDLLLSAASAQVSTVNGNNVVHIPEQLFHYDFDADGDGLSNLSEIEQGSSPNDINRDYDADGLLDHVDQDDDDDGVADELDAFPLNGQEYADHDGDGIGDNADNDDDNDGVNDTDDAFPTDASEVIDSDGDGIGDNADTDANGNGIEDVDEDSDGDGVPDPIDLFPADRYEWADQDGDGIGDNADDDDNANGIRDFREGAEIIVPYVDNHSISINGMWFSNYVNGVYVDEWSKATNRNSLYQYLSLQNLQVDNTGRAPRYSNSVGTFRMLHDGTYLYVLVNINSERLENRFNDSDNLWDDDSIEVYFDVGNDKLDSYGSNDYQRLFRFRDDDASKSTLDGFHSASGMKADYATDYRHENSESYTYGAMYELRIELASIGLKPGERFGFDLAVNDDDNGGERDTKWAWWAPADSDDSWFRPADFGTALLQPVE